MATSFSLSYEGYSADQGEINFYDVSQALVGFQRSLALTAHLVLNNEVITQATALKGASLRVRPPERGSWMITTGLMFVAGATYKLATLKPDNPLGHLVASAYDYVVSETLGFHVDYEQTLGKQLEEFKKNGNTPPMSLAVARLDSLCEKCLVTIKDMHRPIVFSQTAKIGQLTSDINGETSELGQTLDSETYDYVSYEATSDTMEFFEGRVTSYNINTFKGRIYVSGLARPLPFTLAEQTRNDRAAAYIGNSLASSARIPPRRKDDIRFTGFRISSRSGKIKEIHVTVVGSCDL